MRRAALLAAAVGALVLAPAAHADETVYAVPVDRYSSSVITIDQGETLFFRNADLNRHDLVSKAQEGGKPIFSTPLLSTGGEAVVQGAQTLKGGNYEFFCTVHTYMTGTLTVTGAGAPAPSPSPQSDTTAPTVSVKVVDSSVSKVVKNKKLRVDVTTNEGGNATLTATTRYRNKTVTIARGTKGFARAARATVAMALTKAGQQALKGRKSAAVLVQVHQSDAAGNAGHGRGSRTLKR